MSNRMYFEAYVSIAYDCYGSFALLVDMYLVSNL